MSVADDSDVEGEGFDVDGLIERALSSGAKTADALFKAVMLDANVSERTYYRHLEKLLRMGVIEQSFEQGEDGRSVKKYALKPPVHYEYVVPSRRLLEIAAWLRKEPESWPPLNIVGKARVVEKICSHFVPSIEPPIEDPDYFAYVWPNRPSQREFWGEYVQSRFFRLKDIYCAIAQAQMPYSAADCVCNFVGAFESASVAELVTEYEDMSEQLRQCNVPLKLRMSEGAFSVCVAVCWETSGVLRVVHVEGRKSRLDKDWVRGVSRHLNAKAERVLESGKLKEDARRDLLTGLNDALRRQLLAIPDRYLKLTDELLDYSYGRPASGYALALALAVDASRKQKSS